MGYFSGKVRYPNCGNDNVTFPNCPSNWSSWMYEKDLWLPYTFPRRFNPNSYWGTRLFEYSCLLTWLWECTVYGKVTESIPDDIPEPLGKPVVLTHYKDANLYHDLINGRAVTGVLHLINKTPIDWYSKRQATQLKLLHTALNLLLLELQLTRSSTYEWLWGILVFQ